MGKHSAGLIRQHLGRIDHQGLECHFLSDAIALRQLQRSPSLFRHGIPRLTYSSAGRGIPVVSTVTSGLEEFHLQRLCPGWGGGIGKALAGRQ